MKFLFTVFELPFENEVDEFVKEFKTYDDARCWASKTYNTDTYCCVEELED